MNSKTPDRPRSYGRLRARTLRPSRQNLMDTLLPELSFDLQGVPLDPKTLFSDAPQDVWLEIGFGGGEHLAAQAARYPDIGFIGCEVFENGIASCLAHIQDNDLKNIRLFPEDVRDLLDTLKPNSLSKIFVLFPDPWPKRDHHRRRLIQKETLDLLAQVLEPEGALVCASDEPSYIPWIQERVNAHSEFSLENAGQEHLPLSGWVETRYEKKAKREGRKPAYMLYKRL